MNAHAPKQPHGPSLVATPRLIDDAGWFWRVRHTPLTDALRGEWNARLSIAYEIDQANLPAPLPRTILRLVQRTRLWHRERLEVARELIAHFSDGLNRGATPEDLVRSFGDERQAATLIRRAKKRNRPLWWRSARRTVQAAIMTPLILILIYGVIAARYFAGSPTISRDYLAELNQPAVKVPADQRAWPLYRAALLAMPELDSMIYAPQRPARLVMKPGFEQWELFDTYASQHESQLAMVRQAAAMPGLGYVMRNSLEDEDRQLWPDWDGASSPVPLIAVRLPFRELRMLIVLLEVDSHRAVMQGHSQRIIENIAAIIGINRHMREQQTFLGDLVSLAHMQAMFDHIGEWLWDQPQLFTADQLQDIAHRLASLDNRTLRLGLDGERRFFYDIVQRIYTDNGHGDGRITPEGIELLNSLAYRPNGTPYYESSQSVVAPAMGMLVLSRKDLLDEYDRLMDAMEQNAERQLWQVQEVGIGSLLPMLERDSIDRWRYLPMVRMMPSFEHTLVQQHYVRGSRDGILTAIALELHRRKTNAWPQSLDELTPSLLPVLPLDPFDGQVLRYTVVNGSPLLYSIGADRNDDGGVPSTDPTPGNGWRYPRPWSRQANAGDWVLWPIVEDVVTPQPVSN